MSGPQGGTGGRPVGLPKTGGRKKGTPNRATVILREKLAALGCDPPEELAKIAQDPKTSIETKVHIYSNLMPYLYPKRKLTDASDAGQGSDGPQSISPEEALALARDLIAIFGSRAEAERVNEGESTLVEEHDET